MSDDYLERTIRQSRLFILGAGFSAGAGIPLTQELLVRTMKKFSEECPGLYKRVVRHARESVGISKGNLDFSKVDFSNLCTFLEFNELREYGGGERWCENGSREKLALRFYLAKTIVECTPSAKNLPEIYLNFARQLSDKDIVISFNWDGLLETSLSAVGKEYTYNSSNEKAIKLFKLHGSVNWRLGEPNLWTKPVNTLDWQSLNFTEGMMKREIYYTPFLLDFLTWHYYRPLGEVDPFLILPGYGKAFDVRSNAPLWYKPEWSFAFTHDIYIIGLGLASDDFFIRSFFLSNLPYIKSFSGVKGRKIFIINPDPLAKLNYEFVLSRKSAKLLSEPFLPKHIELINKRFEKCINF